MNIIQDTTLVNRGRPMLPKSSPSLLANLLGIELEENLKGSVAWSGIVKTVEFEVMVAGNFWMF